MTNRASLARWQRAVMTAAIAYALALQALLYSFGGALHAEASLFEGVVCAQTSESSGAHGPAQAHDALCCILSCHVAAASGVPMPDAASLLRPASLSAVVAFLPDESRFVRSFGFLPVGSRAPPRRA
ncbi:DUF2946 family protein [Microvirga puerhi]|uniref:DUF2946 family protein n=1 Tax=Microvirga puerhi TaxID=2876078 RepID=A0ABS7VKR8_9HYPH|nr:DUF2946 family protein [Microvirga puerhi]MBZ6075533.1 DUF2946 family protein [Microvirga puerhi]